MDDVTRQALNRQLYHSITDALKEAKSEKEVEDVDVKFNLHFPPGEVEEVGQFKRPKRKSLYSICHKAGLWEVANQFGRSAEQLGQHLTLTRIPVRDLTHTLHYHSMEGYCICNLSFICIYDIPPWLNLLYP
jgi:transcription elongation factor SPT6